MESQWIAQKRTRLSGVLVAIATSEPALLSKEQVEWLQENVQLGSISDTNHLKRVDFSLLPTMRGRKGS